MCDGTGAARPAQQVGIAIVAKPRALIAPPDKIAALAPMAAQTVKLVTTLVAAAAYVVNLLMRGPTVTSVGTSGFSACWRDAYCGSCWMFIAHMLTCIDVVV